MCLQSKHASVSLAGKVSEKEMESTTAIEVEIYSRLVLVSPNITVWSAPIPK
jgi:hypothetical protein